VRKLLCLLLGPLLVAAAEDPATAPLRCSVRPDEGLLEVSYQDRRVLLYAFATNQFKPYVRELCTLAGDNLLLDAPPDHLHHHGLMYAIRVNGVNFWEERDAPGCERPVRMAGPEISRSPAGLPRASFTQWIHWVANSNRFVADSAAVALLVERRTLTLTIDQAQGEVALSWRAEFEPGPSAARVTLSGANYHGLGLRLPEAFNRVARHENSERAGYSNPGGEVTAARWSSVSHGWAGRTATAALFARSSERGLPRFFTMVEPFTYLSVTQGLDKAPIEYAAGDRFNLDYLLVVYPERKAADFLQQRYDNWAGK
jgi:hypothetical protein